VTTNFCYIGPIKLIFGSSPLCRWTSCWKKLFWMPLLTSRSMCLPWGSPSCYILNMTLPDFMNLIFPIYDSWFKLSLLLNSNGRVHGICISIGSTFSFKFRPFSSNTILCISPLVWFSLPIGSVLCSWIKDSLFCIAMDSALDCALFQRYYKSIYSSPLLALS